MYSLLYSGTFHECRKRTDGCGRAVFQSFCTSLERGDPGGDYPGAVCVPGGGQENDADQHCVGGVSERGAAGADNRRNFTDVPDRLSGKRSGAQCYDERRRPEIND